MKVVKRFEGVIGAKISSRQPLAALDHQRWVRNHNIDVRDEIKAGEVRFLSAEAAVWLMKPRNGTTFLCLKVFNLKKINKSTDKHLFQILPWRRREVDRQPKLTSDVLKQT